MPRTRSTTPVKPEQPVPRASEMAPALPEPGVTDQVDTRYLQSLLGYSARRTALSIIERFLQGMAAFKLRPVEFSVMSVIHHNPGVTSRQLCAALNLLPPNLVRLIQSLETRGLIRRLPHPHDGRAVRLQPTSEGHALMLRAEQAAADIESPKLLGLTPAEHRTLLKLLPKVYL